MKIGITGHQDLENIEWVQDELQKFLRSSAPPLTGITSLAIGADQLFAQAVLECNGTLHVVVPMPLYEESFRPRDLKAYQQLTARALFVEVLPAQETDEESYFAAGKRVADLSDMLIAVWDGEPAAGVGGTADVVRYAQGKNIPCLHVNPILKTSTER